MKSFLIIFLLISIFCVILSADESKSVKSVVHGNDTTLKVAESSNKIPTVRYRETNRQLGESKNATTNSRQRNSRRRYHSRNSSSSKSRMQKSRSSSQYETQEKTANSKSNTIQPCTCAVFFSGQFKKGSRDQPTGHAALINEQDRAYQCNLAGVRQCQNKCLESIVKHLPNSQNILCATADRDCYKERAYLFVKNCNNVWHNTNFSAGKEYCCKNGSPYQCPLF